jgi:transposase InsO family protein
VSDDNPLPDPLPALQLNAPTHAPSFDDVYGTTGRPTQSTPPARILPPPPPPYNHAHSANTSSRARLPSDQDIIREKTMAGVPTWPPNLRLSLNANNWLEWSRELINGLKMAQLHVYPLGLLSCPSQHTDRISHRNWRGNNQMVLGYIATHIFPAESQHIANCATSADAYQSLRQRHEKRGGLKQTQLIQQLMHVKFDRSLVNSDHIMTHVHDIVYHVEQIGHVDVAKLACLFIVHGLRTTHPSVHEALAPELKDGTITLDSLEQELNYQYDLESSTNPDLLAFPSMSPILPQLPLSSVQSSPSSPNVALPASLPPWANICPNCKRHGHSIEFCIVKGGHMEGRTAAEAIAAQCTAGLLPRIRVTPSFPPSTDSPIQLERDGSITIGGTRYNLTRQPTLAPATASIAEVEIDAAMTAADQGEYSDWGLNNGNPGWGSTDGTFDTASFLLATINPDTVPTGDVALIAHRDHDSPLYLDSGASAHISCVLTDFHNFSKMEPRAITGVGNSTVFATGMGTIEISIPDSSTSLILRNVLYAPDAGIRLISISRLDESGHRLDFVDGRCIISDHASGATIADCPKNLIRLYVLPGSIRSFHHSPPSHSFPLSPRRLNVPTPALIATPDLETWHRRLGHANFQTVLDMTRSTHITGMPVNTSTAPQTCDACIRSKQTHHPVPKTREGQKATRRLERIFVDLTGPQSVVSRAGCSYIMNIIDDYSGYHWTRLLKAKSEAARELREWLLIAENQSRERLCYLVTDNGELCSGDMARWCAERGITHQLTAPYTSAQNGRVERLHRTLMNKAHTMCLSCNAPLNLWDEFILTASYLSTLTVSKALDGRSPFELWFGFPPSLAHLREIGCRTFVFIHGVNPKIAARSVEGTLIGYAANAKAYRCWFRDSGRVVDSFHVSFIEHLDSQPLVSPLTGDSNSVPPAGESTNTPTSATPPAIDGDSSSPVGGTASLPTPSGTDTDDAPRRSACG